MPTDRKQRLLMVGAMAAVIYGFGNLYQPTVVVGESMSPTLKDGRVIWIDRTYYKTHKPKVGEVLVFKDDTGMTYVKRVYRGPGETLHYIASGANFLLPVREPFAESLRIRYDGGRGSLRIRQMRVDNDSVFVLGDNFGVSIDSRQLGPVPLSSIIGRAHLTPSPALAMQYEFVPKTLGRRQFDLARAQRVPQQPASEDVPSPSARLASSETPHHEAHVVLPAVVHRAPEFRTSP